MIFVFTMFIFWLLLGLIIKSERAYMHVSWVLLLFMMFYAKASNNGFISAGWPSS